MAPFKKYRKNVPKRYRKKPTVRKAIRKVKNASFKKRVLSVIRAQSETKHAFHSQNLVNFNSGINSAGDCLQVLPNITNGTGDSQRIGDQIRATSCVIKGYCQMAIRTDVNEYSSRKIAVRMMIVKPKRYGTFGDTSAGYTQWQTVLLKKGSSTSGFTGAISDLWAPLNTDVVTKLYDKVFYMSQSPMIQYSAVGVATPSIANTTRVFTIKVPCKNRLFKYDLNNDNGLLPVGENWTLICGYVHMDGTSADVLESQVSVAFDTNLMYEDA